MTLPHLVTSLELSKRLKELGVKQESLFYWRLSYHTSESFDKGISQGKVGNFGDYRIEYLPKPRYSTADVKWNERDLSKLDETEFSAFTAGELGELLPKNIKYNGSLCYIASGRSQKPDTEQKWGCAIINSDSWTTVSSHLELADTEADARALILCHLIENGLINVKE